MKKMFSSGQTYKGNRRNAKYLRKQSLNDYLQMVYIVIMKVPFA